MNLKRVFSLGLIFLGIYLIFLNRAITGSIIGSSEKSQINMIGMLIFFIGIIFYFLKAKVSDEDYRRRESHLKEILGQRYNRLSPVLQLEANKALRKHEQHLLRDRLYWLRNSHTNKDLYKDNLAADCLSNGHIPEKRRELISIAQKCGYNVETGGDGYVVRGRKKEKITEIEKHNNIPRGTAVNILKALAKGKFYGRKAA